MCTLKKNTAYEINILPVVGFHMAMACLKYEDLMFKTTLSPMIKNWVYICLEKEYKCNQLGIRKKLDWKILHFT